MAFLSNILRMVWALYTCIAYLIVVLVPIIIFLFPFILIRQRKIVEQIGYHLHYKILHPIWLLLLGIRVEQKTRFKKPSTNQGYIVVCNHQSFFDIPVGLIITPFFFKMLGKASAKKVPIFGTALPYFAFLLDRSNATSRAESYERLKQSIQQGESVFIYPEGTRNKTQQHVQPFYDGAFRLAIETQSPLLVHTLIGTRRLLSANETFKIRPGKVFTYTDQPIETKGLTLEDMPALKEQVKAIMEGHIQQYAVKYFRP